MRLDSCVCACPCGKPLSTFPGHALALQHLELRRSAGAEEAEIAADREETDAALGAGDRALGVGTVETRDLAGLAARRHDLVERRLDGIGVRIKLLAVG